jgi:hypothetical protein
MPAEKTAFRHHCVIMRRIFGRKKRAITVLHRNGNIYKISPRSGRMRRIEPDKLPKYGPYKIASRLPYPDELLR